MSVLRRIEKPYIYNKKQIHYMIQTDGEKYLDIQIGYARLTSFEKSYDHCFFLTDGGAGLAACERKFPGLLKELVKKHQELKMVVKSDGKAENGFV
jgi:hypothetical protein